MPLYEYECLNGHKFNRVLPVKHWKTPQTCECGSEAKKLISAPMIAPSFEDYVSPIDGSPITSKRKRKEEMARHNCVDYEPSMVDESTRRMKEGERKLEKEIDRTVDAAIEQMTPRQRELLDSEMRAGADIDYMRSTKE